MRASCPDCGNELTPTCHECFGQELTGQRAPEGPPAADQEVRDRDGDPIITGDEVTIEGLRATGGGPTIRGEITKLKLAGGRVEVQIRGYGGGTWSGPASDVVVVGKPSPPAPAKVAMGMNASDAGWRSLAAIEAVVTDMTSRPLAGARASITERLGAIESGVAAWRAREASIGLRLLDLEEALGIKNAGPSSVELRIPVCRRAVEKLMSSRVEPEQIQAACRRLAEAAGLATDETFTSDPVRFIDSLAGSLTRLRGELEAGHRRAAEREQHLADELAAARGAHGTASRHAQEARDRAAALEVRTRQAEQRVEELEGALADVTMRDIGIQGAGVRAINAERIRQVADLGYDTDHDDGHTEGQLAWAAVAYAAPDQVFMLQRAGLGFQLIDCYPFDDGDDRPRVGPPPGEILRAEELAWATRRDLLVKAGALLAAEIDRLDRIEMRDRRKELERNVDPGDNGVEGG